MNKFAKMAVAAAIAGFGFAANAGIVIDEFNASQPQFITDNTTGDGGVWSSSGFSASILGGYRDIYAEKLGSSTSDPAGSFPGTGVSMGVYADRLNFNTATGDNATGIVRWDGANTGPAINATGLGSVDFTNGANAFKVNVFNSDLGFPFAIEVYTDATHWSRLIVSSVAVAAGIPDTSPIQFADFMGVAGLNNFMLASGALLSTGSGGAADFEHVGALQAIINLGGTTGAVDLSIDAVSTIPEPASLALVGAALMGVGIARRRKSAK